MKQTRSTSYAQWCLTAAAGVMVLVVAGCGAAGPLIPEQQTSRSTAARPPPAPEAYRVSRGDTLYSIAFRHGLDWRDVARWNGISAPYSIQTGDWVRLKPRLKPQPDMRPAVTVANRPDATESGPEPESEPEPEPEPARPSNPPVAAAGDSSADRTSGTGVGSSESPPLPTAPTRSVGGVAWRWPTKGRVARGFESGASRKGILIAGEAGQPVRAAANGEVVYSGNGLIGYGELIIIKHSERMLSAYAHNRERLVGEGDTIQAGAVIARMGNNERDQQVLHFEIRRDGNPVDPVDFLPRR